MASKIPDSRLGRALMAGIPVAFAMLGAELIDGAWQVERKDGGFALSWMSAREAVSSQGQPAVQLTTCFGDGCGRWTLAVSLPEHHLGTDMTSFARSMVSVVTGDCTEGRSRSRTLASA